MAQLLDPQRDPQAVARAAARLARGELLAFPTETVYGLGARADNAAAVARIFAAKGRPTDHPLIVHVDEPQAVAAFALDVPPVAQRLMAAFWPGPLTLILRRRPGVAEAAAGGHDTIGLRCPSHPVALALLRAAREAGVPGVAGPSANRFGRVSPTRAEHVMAEFPGDDVAVLDGGRCDVGIESAIVDCSRGVPVLLRPGGLSREVLARAAGEALHQPDAQAPRAAGTLAAHYAPHAKVRLMPAAALREALAVWADAVAAKPPAVAGLPPGAFQVAESLGVYSRTVLPPPGIAHRRMPDDAAAAAQALFATLRDFDDLGVALIWVEAPPPDPAWEGVRDRLTRAAAAA